MQRKKRDNTVICARMYESRKWHRPSTGATVQGTPGFINHQVRPVHDIEDKSLDLAGTGFSDKSSVLWSYTTVLQ